MDVLEKARKKWKQIEEGQIWRSTTMKQNTWLKREEVEAKEVGVGVAAGKEELVIPLLPSKNFEFY